MTTKIERRIKIKYRVRNKISGTAERPRMSVFRSNKQIYVQVIDDLSGRTLAAASSLGMETMPKKAQAAKVGELIAKKAQEAGIIPSCSSSASRGRGGMADAHGSGPCGGNPVEVQLLSPAPFKPRWLPDGGHFCFSWQLQKTAAKREAGP